jgi:hypothetical protein
MLDEWNVKFAERAVNEKRGYSSRAMNCRCALLAWLDCGREGLNTAKSAGNTGLMAMCGKAAL